LSQTSTAVLDSQTPSRRSIRTQNSFPVSNSGINTGASSSNPAPLSGTTSSSGEPQNLCIALYDYDGRNGEDLAFRKGELFVIIDDSQGDWWIARSNTTGKEGYIPSNFVAKYRSLEAEP
jgi:hypothetical protein